MKKYTKHFIELAFDKLAFNEFFFESEETLERSPEYIIKNYSIETKNAQKTFENKYKNKRYVVRYPEIITSGRPLAKIRFFDISFIEINGLLYKSDKHNYSNWICFGERVMSSEEESLCFNGNNNFVMGQDDITYKEYVENYFDIEKNKKSKVKTLTV